MGELRSHKPSTEKRKKYSWELYKPGENIDMQLYKTTKTSTIPVQKDTIPVSGESLEEGMATHSSVLTWRIPRTEEPGGLQPMESQRDTTEVTDTRMRVGFSGCGQQVVHRLNCQVSFRQTTKWFSDERRKLPTFPDFLDFYRLL